MKYFGLFRRDRWTEPVVKPVTKEENTLSETIDIKKVRCRLIAPKLLAAGPSSPMTGMSSAVDAYDGQIPISRSGVTNSATSNLVIDRNSGDHDGCGISWALLLEGAPICKVCSRNRIGSTSVLNRQVFWTLRHLRVSNAVCPSCCMIANAMGDLLHTEVEDGLVCGRVEHFATDCRTLHEARRLWLFTTSIDQIRSHVKQSLVPRSYLEPEQPTTKTTLGCIQLFESGGPNLFSGRYVNPKKTDISLISGWLSTCESSHNAKCGRYGHHSTGAPALRVLDVLKGCVVIAPVDCRYFALSYV
jgi:hypothetical protein